MLCISIVPEGNMMSESSNKQSNRQSKSLKDLSMIDNFMFAEATEDSKQAKIIAEIIIRRVLGINIGNVTVETEKQLGKSGIIQSP